jgi:glycosyltransferase involved in cell wall biosynthesis
MITVVVPFLNAQMTLNRCLTSIVRQSYTDWECILVNDGSNDESASIAKSFLNDPRFRYVENATNLGVSTSRNIGNRVSHKQFISVLDADDEMTADRLSRSLSIFTNFPSVGIIGGKAIESNVWQSLSNTQRDNLLTGECKVLQLRTSSLLFGCPYVHSSVTYRKELFLQPFYLSYNPSYLVAHDYDIYRQIASTDFVLAITDTPFCIRHETGSGLMDRLTSRMIKESISIKTQINLCLLPHISAYTAKAVSELLTYNQFVSEDQRNECANFLACSHVQAALDNHDYKQILLRFEQLEANG